MPTRYEVVLRRSAKKGWRDICARDPNGAAETLHFLQNTPEMRIPGKAKKLRGKLRGLLQYNVNYSDRVQYWVDKGRGTVWVEYAGPHP